MVKIIYFSIDVEMKHFYFVIFIIITIRANN
jgi:hypothetical protein